MPAVRRNDQETRIICTASILAGGPDQKRASLTRTPAAAATAADGADVVVHAGGGEVEGGWAGAGRADRVACDGAVVVIVLVHLRHRVRPNEAEHELVSNREGLATCPSIVVLAKRPPGATTHGERRRGGRGGAADDDEQLDQNGRRRHGRPVS